MGKNILISISVLAIIIVIFLYLNKESFTLKRQNNQERSDLNYTIEDIDNKVKELNEYFS
jgi:hypothetical protein